MIDIIIDNDFQIWLLMYIQKLLSLIFMMQISKLLFDFAQHDAVHGFLV